MRSRGSVWLVLAVCAFAVYAVAAQDWKVARAGFPYSFPRDHFAHNDFQTEWWYYTGNVRSEDGHRFGYELTFFRQGVRLEHAAGIPETWRPDQMYLAHFALSDLEGREFFHTKRLNRSGAGVAGGGGEAGHQSTGK